MNFWYAETHPCNLKYTMLLNGDFWTMSLAMRLFILIYKYTVPWAPIGLHIQQMNFWYAETHPCNLKYTMLLNGDFWTMSLAMRLFILIYKYTVPWDPIGLHSINELLICWNSYPKLEVFHVVEWWPLNCAFYNAIYLSIVSSKSEICATWQSSSSSSVKQYCSRRSLISMSHEIYMRK